MNRMHRNVSIARRWVAHGHVALLSGLCWLANGVAQAQPAHSGEVESGAQGAVHHTGITLFNWPSAEDPRIGLGYLVINFLVLAFLIHRLILRKLIQDNAVRHDDIRRQVEAASESLAEATSLVADYKSRIERVAQESQQILEQSRRSAETDRQRLLAEAEVEVERFKAAAMAAAQREVSQRRAQLEGEVVDRAITRATELLRARFNDADQSRLVDDFAVELAGTSTARAPARA
jgi:F-type H+-transporting ATPase subunit b